MRWTPQMTVSTIKPTTFRAFVTRYGLFYISISASVLVLCLCVLALIAGIFLGWLAFAFTLSLIPLTLFAQLHFRFSAWPDAPIDTSNEISFESGFISHKLLLNSHSISELSNGSVLWSSSWQDIARFAFFPGDKYSPTHFYFLSSCDTKEIRLNAIGYRPDPQYVAEAIRLFWQGNRVKDRI